MARRPPPDPPKLERGKGAKVSPKLRVTIYCEGANTEPGYFEEVAKVYGNGLVDVESVPGAGVPLTLVEKAVAAKKEQKRRRKNSFEENDQVWVAFDRDNHPHIPQAQQTASSNGVGVAFTNPCFELWILLHIRDYDAPDNRYEIQNVLKGNLPSYDPNGAKKCDFKKLADGVPKACERAVRMRQRRIDEGKPRETPYTDVDLLVQVIIENGKGDSSGMG